MLGDTPSDSKVSFTLGASEVKTVVKSVHVEGDRVEFSYDFDIEGNGLTSTVSGKRQGAKLEGTYRTVVTGSSDQVDSGTFTTSE